MRTGVRWTGRALMLAGLAVLCFRAGAPEHEVDVVIKFRPQLNASVHAIVSLHGGRLYRGLGANSAAYRIPQSGLKALTAAGLVEYTLPGART